MSRLLLLLLLLIFSATPVIGGDALRFELVHGRPNAGATRLDHFRGLITSDRHRQLLIFARTTRGRPSACEVPANSSAFEMPLASGAYKGTGQYFVRLRVGTPSQGGFVMVVDTGSDLTWVNCRSSRRRCPRCSNDVVGRRVFNADKSNSFRPITCSSDMCMSTLPFALSNCPTPVSPCDYDYGYSDGSTAQGFFAKESATVALSGGEKTKLKGLVIGCTVSASGTSFRAADGVLGLGYSNISFAKAAAGRFDGRFAYCLVDHLSPRNVSSYLLFGANWLDLDLVFNRTQSTALLLLPQLLPLYAVGVAAISVAGERLAIPAAVWDASLGGGTIVDSGTSLTVLAVPAYKAVTLALDLRLRSLPRVDVDPFEFCYNWTAAPPVEALVPQLVVHFSDSARLEPPAKSYVIDVADEVKCLGITSASFPGISTIGNILQQEHIWEYDIKNQRLRFQQTTCVGH